MWYLLAAVIGSSSLVILLKLFQVKGVDLSVGITVNYIVGALLSFVFAPVQIGFAEITGADWFAISMLVGALFSLSFFVYAFSAQVSGVAITTISGRAAVVIPVLFAFLALGEQPSAVKLSMLALILLSMFLILYRGGEKSGSGKGRQGVAMLVLLPLAVFLFNGMNDTLVQYAQREMVPGELIPVFMGTMFLAGGVTGLVCYGISAVRTRHIPNGRDLTWGSLLGFMNWVCMVGVFNALNYLEGSVFYPLYYTGAIVISTIVGVAAFREKLSRLNYLGIGIAVAAIAVLSMN